MARLKESSEPEFWLLNSVCLAIGMGAPGPVGEA